MHKAALLVFIAAFAPQAASAKGGIRVLSSIPDAYWGTWAAGAEPCKEGDAGVVVLAAKAYEGPLGKCDVASVSEAPSPKGSIYSARLQCAAASQVEKKKSANLIIRPGGSNQIYVGSALESLKAHQRCSENTPAK